MTFLWGIIIGLALGATTSFFSKRRDPGSTVTRMIIGAIGGILGAVAARWISPSPISDVIIATAGVIIFLFLYWLVVGNRTAP